MQEAAHVPVIRELSKALKDTWLVCGNYTWMVYENTVCMPLGLGLLENVSVFYFTPTMLWSG